MARLVASSDVPLFLALIYRSRRAGGSGSGCARWSRSPGRHTATAVVVRGSTALSVRLGMECGRCCLDLAYASTRESEADHVVRKLIALRKRLDGPLRLAYPFPDRPNGMCPCTYHCLLMYAYRLNCGATRTSRRSYRV